MSLSLAKLAYTQEALNDARFGILPAFVVSEAPGIGLANCPDPSCTPTEHHG